MVLALFPPSIAAQESLNIDDHTLSELKGFKTLVLTGFTFKDKSAAEKLLRAYVRQGGKLVIDMQSVDEALLGPDQKFLGVKVKQSRLAGKTNFKAAPDAAFDPGRLEPIDFGPNWRAVSYGGLTKNLLEAESRGQSLPVLGYKNLAGGRAFFIGGNLTAFAFEKHDKDVAGVVNSLLGRLETKKPAGSLKVDTTVNAPEKVAFKYRAESAAPALISRTFTPHWRAVLDGRRELTPIKLEGLTGLDLPKGEHEVVLSYGRTPIHPISYAVTGLAWLAAAGLFVFYIRRTR